MIPGFEDYTHELTERELVEVVPLVVKGLKHKVGKKNSISASAMCKALKKQPYNINIAGPRMRKIIRHIRITGMIMNLITDGKGYYVANNRYEIENYIDSLIVRIDAIEYMRKAINWQMQNTYPVSERYIDEHLYRGDLGDLEF